jgi:hypothetical protein
MSLACTLYWYATFGQPYHEALDKYVAVETTTQRQRLAIIVGWQWP